MKLPRIKVVLLAYSLVLGMVVFVARTDAATKLTPLDAMEFQAVTDELTAIDELPSEQVHSVVVSAEMISRLQRLFITMEPKTLPVKVRWAGLAVGGRGAGLMSFEKPSDVLNKVAGWFPDEMVSSRASENERVEARAQLYGPDEHWDDESIAFVALWHCMPKNVWLHPETDYPFTHVKGGFAATPILTSASWNDSFGQCIRERNGRRNWETDQEHEYIKQLVSQMADRAISVLSDKFSRFLAGHRCREKGPDDCVLILSLWASASPADSALAKALKALEPDIRLNDPLPELLESTKEKLQKARTQAVVLIDKKQQLEEPRFDVELRRAAFLRAKLRSVLNNPAMWKRSSVADTLHQMTKNSEAFADTYDDYIAHSYYSQYYGGGWSDLPPFETVASSMAGSLGLEEAIITELDKLPAETPCSVLEGWLGAGGKAVEATYVLRNLVREKSMRCFSSKGAIWDWLRRGETADAVKVRDQYIKALEHTRSGKFHEVVISNLSDQGRACFVDQSRPEAESSEEMLQEMQPIENWQRALCDRWVSEPQSARLALDNSWLDVNNANRFQPTQQKSQPDTAAWLVSLIPNASSKTRKEIDSLVGTLKQHVSGISSVTRWVHPNEKTFLLELHLWNEYPVDPVFAPHYARSIEMLLVVRPTGIIAVNIPSRFEDEIAGVSDADNDGNLEIWWPKSSSSGSFRDCHGDESDLQRNFNCMASAAVMGEIYGDSLSYFVNDAPHKTRARSAVVSHLHSGTPNDEGESHCNAVLIGSLLGEEVTRGMDFRMRENEGDVIDLACAAHPSQQDHLVVAAFHELKDESGSYAGHDGEYGFLLAVIDAKQRKLISRFRSIVIEDGATRIEGSFHALRIGTEMYPVAPNTKALSIIMHTGWSPRCADGFSNDFLWLFVEDGAHLTAVLKDFVTRIGGAVEGSMNCGAEPASYVEKDAVISLSPLSTTTEGYFDLEAIEHATFSATADRQEAMKAYPATKTWGKLKMRANGYELEAQPRKEWSPLDDGHR